MSDLQCPATFHLLGPTAEPGSGDLVHGAPVGAVYVAPGRGTGGPDGPVDAETLPAGPLLAVLDDLADLHRGMHVLVLTDAVSPPLRSAADEVVVRIDADGRSVQRP